MTSNIDTTHVLGNVPDYVLDLLATDESVRVAAHLSSCAACRQALMAERELSRSVRDTIRAVPTPDSARLRQLRPATPDASGASPRLFLSLPGWAAAALMLLLILGTFTFYLNSRPGAWNFTAPTAWSTAVVLTNTPTQTATREIAATAESRNLSSSRGPAPLSMALSQDRGPQPAIAPVPPAPLVQ